MIGDKISRYMASGPERIGRQFGQGSGIDAKPTNKARTLQRKAGRLLLCGQAKA